MFKILVICIYLFSVFLISSIFQKDKPNNNELKRKIIHIGIGPLVPIAQFLKIDQTSALFFTGIISFLVLINYTYKIFPTIEDVERKSFGTIFYCLSLFILISLFWNKDPYALIAGFFIMTFGDGLAGLIGKNVDSKNWIILKQTKSLFGTLTMFFTSFIVVSSLGYAQQNTINFNYIAIAFISTLLEQFSIFGIDNFIVPISSAFCFNFFITNV